MDFQNPWFPKRRWVRWILCRLGIHTRSERLGVSGSRCLDCGWFSDEEFVEGVKVL